MGDNIVTAAVIGVYLVCGVAKAFGKKLHKFKILKCEYCNSKGKIW